MNLVTISVTTGELVALWNLRHNDADTTKPKILPATTHSVSSSPLTENETRPAPLSLGKVHYEVLGERRHAKDSITAFTDILTIFSNLVPGFPERLLLVVPGNSRNHIARSPAGVYPERPDLAKSARRFAPGWYVGSNISGQAKERILRLACEVLGLEFGKDVIFGPQRFNIESLL